MASARAARRMGVSPRAAEAVYRSRAFAPSLERVRQAREASPPPPAAPLASRPKRSRRELLALRSRENGSIRDRDRFVRSTSWRSMMIHVREEREASDV